MIRWAVFATCGVALALSACTEQPQTASARKVDDKPWESAAAGFAAHGYKAGDKGQWESQLKTRALAQNEYNRVPPR